MVQAGETGKPWTNDEIELVVTGYFDLLASTHSPASWTAKKSGQGVR